MKNWQKMKDDFEPDEDKFHTFIMNRAKKRNCLVYPIKEINKPDLQNIGNSGEYFMASILSGAGFTTTITLGRAERYDILAINPKGKTIKLQIKTAWYKTDSWRLGSKDEQLFADDFFYVLVRLNEMKESAEYWIIPSRIIVKFITESHKIWLATLGKKGQKHNDNPGRVFSLKPSKFSPKWWTDKEAEKYYKNVRLLE